MTQHICNVVQPSNMSCRYSIYVNIELGSILASAGNMLVAVGWVCYRMDDMRLGRL